MTTINIRSIEILTDNWTSNKKVILAKTRDLTKIFGGKEDKIKEITLDIQKKLNQNCLEDSCFDDYAKGLLDNNTSDNFKAVHTMLSNIVIMAKHNTNSLTKINWFGVNTTRTIENFIEGLSRDNFQVKKNSNSAITLPDNCNTCICKSVIRAALKVVGITIDTYNNLGKFAIEAGITIPRNLCKLAIETGITIPRNLGEFAQGSGMKGNLVGLDEFAIEAGIKCDSVKLGEFVQGAGIIDSVKLGRFALMSGIIDSVKLVKFAELAGVKEDPEKLGLFAQGAKIAALAQLIKFAELAGIKEDPEKLGKFVQGANIKEPEKPIKFALMSGITDLAQLMKFAEFAGVKDAQWKIIVEISLGNFGKDPKVLQALAISIGEVNITDLFSQVRIAIAISLGRFGTDPNVLQALAISIGKMNITTPVAQQSITEVIRDGKFGKDPKVLQALATSIGNMNVTNPQAQQNITKAIYLGKFGNDTNVLQALVTSIGKMNITDPEAQQDITSAIDKGYLPKDLDLQGLQSRWVILNERGLNNETSNYTHIQFGNGYGRHNYDDLSRLDIKVKGEQVNYTEHCFGPKNQNAKDGYGTYGIIYQQSQPKYLISYFEDILDSDPPLVIAEKEERFKGFFSSSEFAILYLQNLSHVKVFEFIFSNEHKEYQAKIIDNHSMSAELYPDLPPWLKHKLLQNQFKVEDYKALKIIGGILGFIEKLSLTELLTQELKHSIEQGVKSVIKSGGEAVKLSADTEQDMKIKDSINKAIPIADEGFHKTANVCFDALYKELTSDEEKLQLIFLLGQIAKQGALGYHYGDNNQANEFFYSMAAYCTEKLKTEWDDLSKKGNHSDSDNTFLNSNFVKTEFQDFHKGINLGICIESLTHSLAIAADKMNFNLYGVWEKEKVPS